MATIKQYFYNIECDCCNMIADEEMWHDEQSTARGIASEEGWRHLGGKDYCPYCWYWDDDNHIVTADGKVWDDDTEELIRQD